MARIRCHHAAQFAVAIERDAVEAGLFHPVLFFDALTDFLRTFAVLLGRIVQAPQLGEMSHRVECRARIRLHFDECDRTVGEAAIGVEDRIVAVLPALIGETAIGLALIVQQTVTVLVADTRDPLCRALQRRPQLVDQGEVPRAFRIGAGQHDEERRAVDAAVVQRERHLAGGGHFTLAHLVHDLAGRGVTKRRIVARLMFGEKAQHACGQIRLQPQRLQRRDDRIAAERR